jgi:hypothetical protein
MEPKGWSYTMNSFFVPEDTNFGEECDADDIERCVDL